MNLSEAVKDELKLKSILERLPEFCEDFFIATETINTPKTQIRYAYDLDLFFDYVRNELKVEKIDLAYLSTITPKDIELYLHFTSGYVDRNGTYRKNEASSKSNKLSALRSLFRYLYSEGVVSSNPALLVNSPKLRKKNITRLEPAEILSIMDKINSGNGLTGKQLKFAAKTRLRDCAIFTLLLTSGIRVSECVSINLSDICFENGEIRIIRKGLKEQIIYMSDEAEIALKDYIENERPFLVGAAKDEDALFISLKHQRISVRAVENMVSKFTTSDVTAKHITPHKLRSTFASTLYNETGDIYLTASALGHESISTTLKYAQMDQMRVRASRNVVKIREDK